MQKIAAQSIVLTEAVAEKIEMEFPETNKITKV